MGWKLAAESGIITQTDLLVGLNIQEDLFNGGNRNERSKRISQGVCFCECGGCFVWVGGVW